MLTTLLEADRIERIERSPGPASEPADLVAGHGDYLFRFALLRVQNESTAEDLVQETLLAALKNMKDFSHKSSERSWLTAILKNKIVDHFRLVSREVTVDFAAGGDSLDEEFFRFDGTWRRTHRPFEWHASPGAAVESQEFWKIVNRCLSALPQRVAAAFVLRDIEGLSTAEICETLNITPNNLCVMLHRARFRLRREIEVNFFSGGE